MPVGTESENLPVSVLRWTTTREEAAAVQHVERGDWIAVGCWTTFVGGFVSPALLDQMREWGDELIGEAAAARDAERDATLDLERLLAEVGRAVDLLEAVDVDADAATIDAAIQEAVNILLDRS